MKYLTFVTSNWHKFAEAERVLKQFGVIIRHAKLSCPEIRGEEPAGIAADSVRRLKSKVKPPFFVEDAGLFVESLNGFPGPTCSSARPAPRTARPAPDRETAPRPDRRPPPSPGRRTPSRSTGCSRRRPMPATAVPPASPRCRTCSGAESLKSLLSSKVWTCQNC